MTSRNVPAGVLAIMVMSLAVAGAHPHGPEGRAIALTFDDLPYVAVSSSYLPGAQRTTSSLLKILAAHRAPAIGFVNEIQLRGGVDREERIALLRQWIRRGMLLGNHTYSHPDFNTVSVERFQEEIVKGEEVTRRLLAEKPGAPLFFRHPMTHTGDTREKKEAIEKFLAARGYRIAPHTIENSDFVFNRIYALAVAKRDSALATKVRAAYLEFSIAATAFAETIPPKIFGRDVPQTLLLHANDLNADALDELLKRLEGRGYRFISLEQAMADPAYQTADTLVSSFGPTWLWRWNKSLGLNVSFAGDPEPPAWVTEMVGK